MSIDISKAKPRIEIKKLSDLIPADYNARKMSKKARKALENSMKKFGCVELPIWNERTGHIVGGHQRVQILMDDGVISSPVIVVSMDEATEMAANLTLNNKAIKGEFDDPIVELLSQMEKDSEELYKMLRADDLRKKVDKEYGKGGNQEQCSDTNCPYCQHAWRIGPDDVFFVDILPGKNPKLNTGNVYKPEQPKAGQS
jgi:hypothetical protein